MRSAEPASHAINAGEPAYSEEANMPEPIPLAKTDPPPEPGGFVTTPTAQKIVDALELITVLPGPQMAMIAGVPGIGKTEAAKHFKMMNSNVLIVTAAGSGNRKTRDREPAELLASHCHVAYEYQNETSIRRSLREGRQLSGATIIFDEANNLSETGLEWLRITCEEAGANLALIGDMSLAQKLKRLSKLWTRADPKLILGAATAQDLQQIAASYGVRCASALAALSGENPEGTATRQIRSVVKVLQLAAILARQGDITQAHINTALAQLRVK